jgi:tripartite-type tricarboxylate transporter receptor subunit TctC
VVENKAGGGTIIGTEIVAAAKPDGYTILLTPAALIANAAFGVKVPYDIDKDLVPVVGFVDLAVLLAAATTRRSSRSPSCWPMPRPIPAARSLRLGRVGSLTHLWGEFVKARMKLPLEHVGYKGSAEALKDVMAGTCRCSPTCWCRPRPRSAPARCAARRRDAQRVSLLPDVPTVGEAGLPGTECTIPFGISVPARHAASSRDAAQRRVQRGARRSGVTAQDDRARLLPVGGEADSLCAGAGSEIAKWRQVIKDSNIPPRPDQVAAGSASRGQSRARRLRAPASSFGLPRGSSRSCRCGWRRCGCGRRARAASARRAAAPAPTCRRSARATALLVR